MAPENITGAEKLVSSHQLARAVGVHGRIVAELLSLPGAPPPVKTIFNSRRLWLASVVRPWVEAQLQLHQEAK